MSEFVHDRDIDIIMMNYINHVPESFFPRDLVFKAFPEEYRDLAIAVSEGYVSRKTLTSRMNLKCDPSSYITFDDMKVDTTKRRVLSSR